MLVPWYDDVHTNICIAHWAEGKRRPSTSVSGKELQASEYVYVVDPRSEWKMLLARQTERARAHRRWRVQRDARLWRLRSGLPTHPMVQVGLVALSKPFPSLFRWLPCCLQDWWQVRNLRKQQKGEDQQSSVRQVYHVPPWRWWLKLWSWCNLIIFVPSTHLQAGPTSGVQRWEQQGRSLQRFWQRLNVQPVLSLQHGRVSHWEQWRDWPGREKDWLTWWSTWGSTREELALGHWRVAMRRWADPRCQAPRSCQLWDDQAATSCPRHSQDMVLGHAGRFHQTPSLSSAERNVQLPPSLTAALKKKSESKSVKNRVSDDFFGLLMVNADGQLMASWSFVHCR